MPAESERSRQRRAKKGVPPPVLIMTWPDVLRARENLRRMAEAEELRQTPDRQKRRDI